MRTLEAIVRDLHLRAHVHRVKFTRPGIEDVVVFQEFQEHPDYPRLYLKLGQVDNARRSALKDFAYVMFCSHHMNDWLQAIREFQ